MTSVGSVYDYLDTARSPAKSRTASRDSSFDDVWKQTEAATKQMSTGHSSETEESDRRIAIAPGTEIIRMTDLIASGKVKAIKIAELPEDRYQDHMDGEKRRIEANARYLEGQYTSEPQFPDLSNYPGAKNYADVVVGGQVVARVDNQGVITIFDDAIADRLRGKLPDEWNGKGGPDLSQARAEAAAKLLGGRVVKASTAITQSQFDALPVPQVIHGQVDYDAMKNDPEYQKIEKMREYYRQIELDRAAYLAKQQANETTG